MVILFYNQKLTTFIIIPKELVLWEELKIIPSQACNNADQEGLLKIIPGGPS